MESLFFEAPRKTKIGSKDRRVVKLGVKLQCSTEEGKGLLVRVIGRFENLRVREIGISLPLLRSSVTLKKQTNRLRIMLESPSPCTSFVLCSDYA